MPLSSFFLSNIKLTLLCIRNPALDGEEWPEYTKENPIYRIFNAEGDGKHPRENFGKGPMASACAFWNTYLPRLKSWTGMYIHLMSFIYILSFAMIIDHTHTQKMHPNKLNCTEKHTR